MSLKSPVLCEVHKFLRSKLLDNSFGIAPTQILEEYSFGFSPVLGKVHELYGVWVNSDSPRHRRRCSFVAVIRVPTSFAAETGSRRIM